MYVCTHTHTETITLRTHGQLHYFFFYLGIPDGETITLRTHGKLHAAYMAQVRALRF
jgi:hypothetical protein